VYLFVCLFVYAVCVLACLFVCLFGFGSLERCGAAEQAVSGNSMPPRASEWELDATVLKCLLFVAGCLFLCLFVISAGNNNYCLLLHCLLVSLFVCLRCCLFVCLFVCLVCLLAIHVCCNALWQMLYISYGGQYVHWVVIIYCGSDAASTEDVPDEKWRLCLLIFGVVLVDKCARVAHGYFCNAQVATRELGWGSVCFVIDCWASRLQNVDVSICEYLQRTTFQGTARQVG
jgi:hypothetical protein